MKINLKYICRSLGLVAFLGLAAACANVGNPSGGARDEDPPRLVKAEPPMGAVNVSKDQMILTFDEIVNVKDAFSKIVLSPSGRAPRVSSLGRKITIRFDSLQPNTTYTIDFADAIEDNNEANPLQNFAYTFSTGPTLDTLRIAGRVLGSRDLEPRPGILVGVHSNPVDTAFTGIPLLRVAKTDDRGRFIIRGLAPGSYRVFALDDRDADFKYSSDEEEMAFYDFEVTPTTERIEVQDTTYNILGQVDTVTSRMRTRYLPDDLLLRSFVSDRRAQYVRGFERPDSMSLLLKMGAAAKQYPDIRLLSGEKVPAVLESRETLDSVTMWLPPSLARLDTVTLSVGYTRIERGKEPKEISDTLRFIRKKLPAPKKKKKDEKAQRTDSLARITFSLNVLNPGTQEVYSPLSIEAATPLASLDTAAIHLMMNPDSVWRPVPKKFTLTTPDTLAPRVMSLDYPWDYGMKYKLEVDSLAAVDVYGRTSMPLSYDFATRQAGDYCTLALNISGMEEGVPAFVELLDSGDKPVRVATVQNGRAFFPFLQSGRYFARLIEDYNGNGIYDTGDYETLRQPDLAYYYPKGINIKKNWDKEENWDLFAVAIDQMKPTAILKNKPKADKRKRQGNNTNLFDEEEEEPFDPTANPFEERGSRSRKATGERRR